MYEHNFLAIKFNLLNLTFSTFRRISYKWLFVYFNIFILLTLISFSPLVNSLRLRSCRESAGRLQCRLHLRLGAGKWVSWWIPCRNLLFRPVAQKQPKNRGRIRFRDATIGFSWNQSFLRICAAYAGLNQLESDRKQSRNYYANTQE